MGGMEISKELLEHAIRSWLEKNPESKVKMFKTGVTFHSVDMDPMCQTVLCGRPVPPTHVFTDLINLLVPEARVAISRVMAKQDEKVATLQQTMNSKAGL